MSSNTTPNSAAMTAAEFRMIRESLGLPVEWLADTLGTTERTVRRWQAGTTNIPVGVADDIYTMRTQMLDTVDFLVEELLAEEANDDGSRWLTLCEDNPSYWQGHPPVAWPPAWQRAVIARVLEQVPGGRAVILGGVSE